MLKKLSLLWQDIVAVAFIIIFALYCNNSLTKGFPQDLHTDETHWVNHSILETTLLLRPDFTSPYWYLIDPFGSMTPSFGKFAIGLPLLMKELDHISPNYQYYKWKESAIYNWEKGYAANDAAILLSRRIILLYALLALTFIYILIRQISPSVSLLNILLLSTNPLFQFLSTHVLMDIFEYAFLFGSALFSIKALKGNIIKNSAISATLAAVSCSAKMRGGLGLIFLFMIISYLAFVNRKDAESRKMLRKAVWSGILSFTLVFMILNPSMFVKPIEKSCLFLALNSFQQEGLTQTYPELTLTTAESKISAICKYSFIINANIGFWKLECILLIPGFYWLIKTFKGKKTNVTGLTAFYFMIFAINAFWIPLKFPRYFMPFLYSIKLLEACGIFQSIQYLYNVIKSKMNWSVINRS